MRQVLMLRQFDAKKYKTKRCRQLAGMPAWIAFESHIDKIQMITEASLPVLGGWELKPREEKKR